MTLAAAQPRRTAPPSFVTRAPSGPYRGLNPTTKLVISFAEVFIAFGVRGWTGPLVILVIVLVSGVYAGVARRFIPFVLATVPLVISILLINTFLYPGATDTIFTLGPLHPTWSGLTAALQATLRVIAFGMAVALFGLTTRTDELLSDLERRGVGRRPIFVIGAAIGMLPRMIERAREITDAQRARGLDTQGRIWRRVRGLVPLAGPLVLGALTEVEEQTMALEARAFSAPGRRTIIKFLPDSGGQRLLRWALFIGTVALLALSVGGLLRVLP